MGCLEPLFCGEAELLSELLQIAEQTTPERNKVAVAVDGVELMLNAIAQEGVGQPKLVVFVTNESVAVRLAEALSLRLGKQRVLLATDVATRGEPIASRFAGDPLLKVLVLDRSGEEGLDLRFAHGLDFTTICRFPSSVWNSVLDDWIDSGADSDICVSASLCQATTTAQPGMGWLKLLQDGFQIFNHSVSDVPVPFGTLWRRNWSKQCSSAAQTALQVCVVKSISA